MTPLNSLISVWDEFHEIRTSLDRTNEVLILEKESNPRSAVAPAIEGHVLFRNVSFRYPGSQTDAVKDVNLTVLPGQKIAFVGRTGSGKTTLANLMVNFYQPNRGTIFIDQMAKILGRLHLLPMRIGKSQKLRARGENPFQAAKNLHVSSTDAPEFDVGH